MFIALGFIFPYLNVPCMFNKITGLYCPGCGVTRMMVDIIHLNFKEAFYHNMLVFTLLPFLSFYVIYKLYIYIFDKKDNITNSIPRWISITLLIITLSFGVLRNISFFSILAP